MTSMADGHAMITFCTIAKETQSTVHTDALVNRCFEGRRIGKNRNTKKEQMSHLHRELQSMHSYLVACNSRLHASMPSLHVCSTFASPGFPHLSNQAPPGAQQLVAPDFVARQSGHM